MHLILNEFSGNFLTLIFLLFLVLLSINKPLLNSERTNLFIAICIITFFLTINEMMVVIFSKINNPNLRFFEVIETVLDYSAAPVIVVLMGFLATQKVKTILLFTIVPIISNTIFAITSIWTGFYFTVSENCVYSRGPLNIIFIVHVLYLAIVLLIFSLYSNKTKDDQSKITILFPYLLMLFGFVIQMAFKIMIGWGILSVALCLNYQLLRDFQYGFDALTKVRNRFLFHERLEKLKNKKGFFLVIFDINNLKYVNDTYGHIEGDHMISSVAEIISKEFINTGTTYRIGGDEFCVISDTIPLVELKLIIKRINRELKNIKTQAGSLITIASGYSIYNNNPSQTIYDCFNSADSMMYKNKMTMKAIDSHTIR